MTAEEKNVSGGFKKHWKAYGGIYLALLAVVGAPLISWGLGQWSESPPKLTALWRVEPTHYVPDKAVTEREAEAREAVDAARDEFGDADPRTRQKFSEWMQASAISNSLSRSPESAIIIEVSNSGDNVADDVTVAIPPHATAVSVDGELLDSIKSPLQLGSIQFARTIKVICWYTTPHPLTQDLSISFDGGGAEMIRQVSIPESRLRAIERTSILHEITTLITMAVALYVCYVAIRAKLITSELEQQLHDVQVLQGTIEQSVSELEEEAASIKEDAGLTGPMPKEEGTDEPSE